MSVAWFTRLYRLNEAGRFDEAITASRRFLTERPKDYALHLQRAKALLSVGRMSEAKTHLEEAVKWSKGLAAWPWFYLAALHARLGERKAMTTALATALRLDPKLKTEWAASPFFAAYWPKKRKPAAPRKKLVKRPVARRKVRRG
jgi:predicted Zn-dependent protease